ncbi:MAG: hypothetical protein Q7R86_03210 [bacterium]|nr:hypothetical protein [bacterium]
MKEKLQIALVFVAMLAVTLIADEAARYLANHDGGCGELGYYFLFVFGGAFPVCKLYIHWFPNTKIKEVEG